MKLPSARGVLSARLVAALRDGDLPGLTAIGAMPDAPWCAAGVPPWQDEDLQIALWCCYELHYRGFEDVDDRREWDPDVIAFRGWLETRWLAGLRSLVSVGEPAGSVPAALARLARQNLGSDLPGFLARKASLAEFAEYLAHRSVYQLKEADPHCFGIPRLAGRAKAALVEIEADEYGGGRPERVHAELFRVTMRWAGLADDYGRYVPEAPAVTLAVSNLMSLFALHRRWLGALLGHLAVLEMTSTGPSRKYSAAAARLGADAAARRYFDEHVEADAVHEQVAMHDLCGTFAAERPDAAGDILFGAACCLALDEVQARHLLSSWQQGRSSLLSSATYRKVV
jgi:Iron-containing redox enzyme